MDLGGIWERRSIEIKGFLVLLGVTVINAASKTPMIYLLTVAALIAMIYTARKFKNQFGVPLFFRTREEGRNYWGAALAGIFAFLLTLYVPTMNAPFTEKVAIVIAIAILALLVSTLMFGSILADIRDEELDLEKI